jgi:hypothetical protein
VILINDKRKIPLKSLTPIPDTLTGAALARLIKGTIMANTK